MNENGKLITSEKCLQETEMLRLIRQKTLDELISKAVDKATSNAFHYGYLLGQVEERNRHYVEMFGAPESFALKQAQVILDQNEGKEGEL